MNLISLANPLYADTKYLTGVHSKELSSLGQALSSGKKTDINVVDTLVANRLSKTEQMLFSINRHMAFAKNALASSGETLNLVTSKLKALRDIVITAENKHGQSFDYLSARYNSIKDEILSLVDNASFDGRKLFDGSFKNMVVRSGESTEDNIIVVIPQLFCSHEELGTRESKAKLDQLKLEQADIENNLSSRENARSEIQRQIAIIKDSHEKIAQIKAEIERLNIEKTTLKQDINSEPIKDLKARNEEIKTLIEKAKVDNTEQRNELKKIEREIEVLTKQKEELCSKIKADSNEIVEIKSELEKSKSLKKSINELIQNKNRIEKNLQDLEIQFNNEETALKKDIINIEKALSEYEEDRVSLDKLYKNKKNIEIDIQKLQLVKEEQGGLKDELCKVEKTLSNIDVNKVKDKIQTCKESLIALEEALKKSDIDLENNNKSIKSTTEDLNTLHRAKQDNQALEIGVKEQELKEALKLLNTNRDTYVKNVKIDQDNLNKCKDQIKKQEEKLGYYKKLAIKRDQLTEQLKQNKITSSLNYQQESFKVLNKQIYVLEKKISKFSVIKDTLEAKNGKLISLKKEYNKQTNDLNNDSTQIDKKIKSLENKQLSQNENERFKSLKNSKAVKDKELLELSAKIEAYNKSRIDLENILNLGSAEIKNLESELAKNYNKLEMIEANKIISVQNIDHKIIGLTYRLDQIPLNSGNINVLESELNNQLKQIIELNKEKTEKDKEIREALREFNATLKEKGSLCTREDLENSNLTSINLDFIKNTIDRSLSLSSNNNAYMQQLSNRSEELLKEIITISSNVKSYEAVDIQEVSKGYSEMLIRLKANQFTLIFGEQIRSAIYKLID